MKQPEISVIVPVYNTGQYLARCLDSLVAESEPKTEIICVDNGSTDESAKILAAYAARYVAKNIVAAGLAEKCEIQLSYAIGVAQPTSIMVDTFGTGKLHDDKLVEIIRENFDLRPAGIIKMLDLRRPIYKQTSSYGHFGRTDVDLPWEKLDKVDLLKKYL